MQIGNEVLEVLANSAWSEITGFICKIFIKAYKIG
jgi:hypothetical protein